MSRPTVSEKRLLLTSNGLVRYHLKTRYRDGTTHVFFEPLDFLARLATAQDIAAKITDALGGQGILGGELFVSGDQVWFSEVSPRSHDTGLVTLISQGLSEFALHARVILSLPVPGIRQLGPSASCALLLEGDQEAPRFSGLEQALAEPD